MLCQRLRISAPDVGLYSSSWSFNEIFLSSTGSSSEGVVFVAAFDSESDAPGYLDFRRSYEARFMKPVNEFAAAYCYESMLVLDQSITAARSSSPAKVKAAMIAKGAFQGLQGPFTINATGDAVRDFHVIVVRNGEYRIRR